MLTVDEKKNLINSISEKRREISQVQSQLNSINEQKEFWFAKKTELSKKIGTLIDEIRKNRSERDKLTNQVKKDKVERDKFNTEVKQAVDKIQEFKKEKDDLVKKSDVKDPSFLSRKIKFLETKIETEPMSFDKEKQIMKEIRGLRKQLNDAKSMTSVFHNIRHVSKDIDEKKKVAQTAHKKVQSMAKESQEKHEAIITASKEIDTLKKEEEDAFQKFIEEKKKFNELNDKIKKELSELNEISRKLDSEKKEGREFHEKKKSEIIESKKLSVEEKIKKGLKLTTEDFLAFQMNSKDDD